MMKDESAVKRRRQGTHPAGRAQLAEKRKYEVSGVKSRIIFVLERKALEKKKTIKKSHARRRR